MVLKIRAQHPGLDAGRARNLIDLNYPMEVIHVDGDGSPAVLRYPDPPHHRSRAAIGMAA